MCKQAGRDGDARDTDWVFQTLMDSKLPYVKEKQHTPFERRLIPWYQLIPLPSLDSPDSLDVKTIRSRLPMFDSQFSLREI